MEKKVISEAENLLSAANVEKYSKLYQLPVEKTKEVLENAIALKVTLLGCGLTGDQFTGLFEEMLRNAGGHLPEDEDSTSVAYDAIARASDIALEEKKKRDAGREVLRKAAEKFSE